MRRGSARGARERASIDLDRLALARAGARPATPPTRTLSLRRPRAMMASATRGAAAGSLRVSAATAALAARRGFSLASSGTASARMGATAASSSGSMHLQKSPSTSSTPTTTSSGGAARPGARRRPSAESSSREFRNASGPRAFSSRRTASSVVVARYASASASFAICSSIAGARARKGAARVRTRGVGRRERGRLARKRRASERNFVVGNLKPEFKLLYYVHPRQASWTSWHALLLHARGAADGAAAPSAPSKRHDL